MTSDFDPVSFAVSTAAILLTPGPTNTLLAGAGLGQGMRRALPLVAFELAGYLIAISAWGVLLSTVQQGFPWLAVSIRVAGSCYLGYVAIKVWRAARVFPTSAQRMNGPKTLFVATLMNPKGLLFSSVIFPSSAFDNMEVYLAAIALFAFLVVPIGIVWIRFGAELGGGRLTLANPVKLQQVIALTLGAFSVSIMWAAFH